jgi:hypothetical protein
MPRRHRRRGPPEIGLRLGTLPPARRVAADSMPHVSGGIKCPSYFATTRTHCEELAAQPSLRPISRFARNGGPRARTVRPVLAGSGRSATRQCAGGGVPARRVRSSDPRTVSGAGMPAGGGRSEHAAPHREAGSGAQRFRDASSCRVIRAARSSTGGVGQAGCRRNQHLLASGAGGHERAPLPGVRSRTRPAGIPAAEQKPLLDGSRSKRCGRSIPGCRQHHA